MANNYSPVGFHFTVSTKGETESASFQEVSGISMKMEPDIVEGGENQFSYKVPGKVKYDNLVLKRGIMKSSSFKTWVANTLTQGISSPIVPKTIIVELIDVNSLEKVLMTWTFHNAYPVKWEVSQMGTNEWAIESLELAFSYFEQKT